MLYSHYSEVPPELWPWKNFSPDEPNIACPCCGEIYVDVAAMERLQRARELVGRPVKINSGHRCRIRNALVGGAPLSQHKLFAADVSLVGHDRIELFNALRDAGFTSFGYYQTFIHADTRLGRRWFGGKKARQIWTF